MYFKRFPFRQTARGNPVQIFQGDFLRVGGLRSGELVGDRTRDPRIKSALLYQLSYELLKAFHLQR